MKLKIQTKPPENYKATREPIQTVKKYEDMDRNILSWACRLAGSLKVGILTVKRLRRAQTPGWVMAKKFPSPTIMDSGLIHATIGKIDQL
jgi:hypothetical protein